MSLTNKVAIITGASSGIGAAIAILFSKHGASLALVGRNEEGLNSTIEKCEKINRDKIIKIIGDVTNIETLKSAVEEAVKKFGQINTLINNAGVGKFANIETMKIEDYDEVMNTNLRSAIILTQLCVPHLIATKGNIVNVSSVCGTRSFPNILAYGISKAGMDQFTKSVALELAPKGIRVNSVNPGVIITDFQKRAGYSEEAYKQFLEHTKTTHPLGRPGETDEVAKAVLFLASEDSSFTTGELLHVDGGRHAACPR